MAERKDEGPSIVDGVLLRSSPSAVNTFDLCQLKYFYDKVEHLPRKPQGKGAALGGKCHGEVEHFLLTGEDVRGKIPRAGAHLLEPYLARAPFNKGDLMIEHALEGPELVTPGGVRIIGYSDLTVPPLGSRPEIIDHKFKKDLDQYATSEKELETDPQAIVYSEWAFRRWPEFDKVRFTHHNHQTEKRVFAFRTSIVLDREHVREEFAKLTAKIDGPMRAVAAEKKADAVPFDDRACKAFGGCDFARTCPNSPQNRFAASLIEDDQDQAVQPEERKQTKMGLLDQMDSSPATPTPAPATSKAAAPAAPAGGIPAKSGKQGQSYKLPNGKIAELQAVAGPRVFFMGADGAPVTCGADELISSPSAEPAKPAAPAGVEAGKCKLGEKYLVNGELAEFGGTAREFAFFTVGDKPIKLKASDLVQPAPKAPAIDKPAAVLAKDAPASNPAAPQVTKDEAPDDDEEDDATIPSAEKQAAIAAEVAKAEAKKPKADAKPPKTEGAPTPPGGGPKELILSIDCVGVQPNGQTTKDLQPWINAMAAKLAKAEGVPDVRLAKGQTSSLAFGGWRGAMAEAAKLEMPRGFCHVFRGELADPVIEAIAPLATIVYMPVK